MFYYSDFIRFLIFFMVVNKMTIYGQNIGWKKNRKKYTSKKNFKRRRKKQKFKNDVFNVTS